MGLLEFILVYWGFGEIETIVIGWLRLGWGSDGERDWIWWTKFGWGRGLWRVLDVITVFIIYYLNKGIDIKFFNFINML